MHYVKRFHLTLGVFLAAIMVLAASWPAQAAPIPAGYNVWQTITTDNPQKTWTISFNMPMDANTVTNSNIYILDDNGQRLTSTVSLDDSGMAASVAPSSAYAPGEEYRLYITSGVASNKGVKLANQVIVPFVLRDLNKNINMIDSQWSSFVTNLTVVTGPGVYWVKANGISMIYEANGVFSLGMTKLSKGDTVTVQAYDSSGKLLETQKYIVQ